MDAGTLNAFRAYMNLGYRMGFLPYHFSARLRARQIKSEVASDSKMELEFEIGEGEKIWMFNDSRGRLYFLYFLLTMAGINEMFVATRTVQGFQDDKAPMEETPSVVLYRRLCDREFLQRPHHLILRRAWHVLECGFGAWTST